jgi:PAS domain S-box-containing protein
MGLIWILGGASDALVGWAYSIILMVPNAIGFYVYYRYLPHFNMRLNAIQTAFYAVLLVAGLASLVFNNDASDTSGGAVLLLMVGPVAAYAGYISTYFRWKSFDDIRTQLDSPGQVLHVTSAYQAELYVRYVLMDVSHIRALPTSALMRSAIGDSDALLSIEDGAVNTTGVASTQMHRGLALVSAAVRNVFKMVPMTSADAGANRRIISDDDSAALTCDTIYEKASALLPGSALLDIMIANYLGSMRNNRHLERIYLRSAEAKAEHAALDINFFVWQRLASVRMPCPSCRPTLVRKIDSFLLQRDAEQELQALKRMTVIKRMQFEELQEVCNNQIMAARALILQFWSILQEKSPDFEKLSVIGSKITLQLRNTQDSLVKLLDMAPQSASVMRLYANFLLELANDPKKAAELLADADQIEDEQSRNHGAATAESDILLGLAVPDFDLSGETACILRVSAQSGMVGTIVEANPAALKLLGYNRREFVGHNIAAIIPEPIASVHQMYLGKYMHDGKETVVNTSRIFFVQHRAGYVFPARMNLRPLGDEWATVCRGNCNSSVISHLPGRGC